MIWPRLRNDRAGATLRAAVDLPHAQGEELGIAQFDRNSIFADQGFYVNDQTVRPPPAATAPSPRSIFSADAPSVDAADPAAALFAELLIHAQAETPMALAIVGPPGSGKSSFIASTLARAQAIAQAARSVSASPFVARTLTASADLSALPDDSRRADIAAVLSGALQRALRKAGGGWAKIAEDAGAAGADPQVEARAAAENYDDARKRAEAEARDLEKLRGLRARLSDALLFDTPGSKVDSYARGARARIDFNLRRFGFLDPDSTTSYKQLVGEVAEAGGGAKAVPGLLRAIWGFASQRRLLIWALALGLISIALGAAWDSQASWAPGLREQGAAASSAATFLLTHRWLATFRDAAFWIAALLIAINLWRAWRFAQPLAQGAALLQADVAERGAALDAQIAALSKRVEGLRGESETARRVAEDAAARLARVQASRAPLADLAASDPDERFLEALPQALAAQGETSRLVVALDGFDHFAPEAAARVVATARRLLAAKGVAVIAAFDVDKLASALGRDPGERRARFDRGFQAAWRIEPGSMVDQGRAMASLLGAAAEEPLTPPDGARSMLDEPLTTIEQDLLQRVAPLAGGHPRALKRLLNLYRLARLDSRARPALALMLANEIGGAWADPVVANTAIAEGRDEGHLDPRVLAAARAARAAAPTGALTTSELGAARRLARRFVALDA